jgi:hypothetical protein
MYPKTTTISRTVNRTVMTVTEQEVDMGTEAVAMPTMVGIAMSPLMPKTTTVSLYTVYLNGFADLFLSF